MTAGNSRLTRDDGRGRLFFSRSWWIVTRWSDDPSPVANGTIQLTGVEGRRRRRRKRVSLLVFKVRTISTYFGAGSPSASHSMINGLSFSSILCATWNRSSSEGGCLTTCGGDWTAQSNNQRRKQKINFNSPTEEKKKFQRKLSVDWIDTLAASRLYSESDFRDNSAEPSSHPYMKKRVSSLTTDRHFIYSVFFKHFFLLIWSVSIR